MEALITNNLVFVVLVLVIIVPQIIKFANWIIGLVKKHQANQQSAFNQGVAAAQEEGRVEERFEAGELIMKQLQDKENTLEKILLNQQKQLESLMNSDNLEIKQDIKRMWVKVTKFRQPIDYHDLEILNERFKIYKERGGNSWAESMMNDINSKATITSPHSMKDQDQA